MGLPLLQSNRRCLWMSEMSPLDEKETPVKQALTEQTSINVIYWFMCCSELWWLVCGLPHMQTSKPADWGSRLQLKQLKKKKEEPDGEGEKTDRDDHVQSEKWTCTICKTDGSHHLQRKRKRKTKSSIKRSLLLCLSLNASSTHKADVLDCVKKAASKRH